MALGSVAMVVGLKLGRHDFLCDHNYFKIEMTPKRSCDGQAFVRTAVQIGVKFPPASQGVKNAPLGKPRGSIFLDRAKG